MRDDLAREGARRMLMSALEEEVACYVDRQPKSVTRGLAAGGA